MATDDTQFSAVERPVKIPDVFRCEVGNLLSRRTVQRLKPEVIRVLVADGINYRIASLSESRNPLDWALQIEKLGILWRVDRDQC